MQAKENVLHVWICLTTYHLESMGILPNGEYKVISCSSVQKTALNSLVYPQFMLNYFLRQLAHFCYTKTLHGIVLLFDSNGSCLTACTIVG